MPVLKKLPVWLCPIAAKGGVVTWGSFVWGWGVSSGGGKFCLGWGISFGRWFDLYLCTAIYF